MDKIWDRKSFEVGDHWLLWRGRKPNDRAEPTKVERFLYQILSITLFSYLNSSERASISLFNVEC